MQEIMENREGVKYLKMLITSSSSVQVQLGPISGESSRRRRQWRSVVIYIERSGSWVAIQEYPVFLGMVEECLLMAGGKTIAL